MNGEGEYIWNAFCNEPLSFLGQNIYKGSWSNSKRNGNGIMFFGGNAGAAYEGYWYENLKHGIGYLSCGNGKKMQQKTLFDRDNLVGLEQKMKNNIDDYSLAIFAISENINIEYHIYQLLSKLENTDADKVQLLKKFEERAVRNTLVKSFSQLKHLYEKYAKIANTTIMIRYCLWQLYQDMKVSELGLSLIETDLILARYPKSDIGISPHDPFQPIFFWQFLMSLIGVAFHTTSVQKVVNVNEKSVSAAVLKHFLNHFVFENILKISSTSFQCPLNFNALKPMYNVYKNLGEPHTARTFLHKVAIQEKKPDNFSSKCKLLKH